MGGGFREEICLGKEGNGLGKEGNGVVFEWGALYLSGEGMVGEVSGENFLGNLMAIYY